MLTYHADTLLEYLDAVRQKHDGMSYLRLRVYTLMSWLWKRRTGLPPDAIAYRAGMSEDELNAVLDSPDTATFASIRRLCYGLRVDLDWLDPRVDVMKYVERWGVPHPYDSGCLDSETRAEKERLLETRALMLCREVYALERNPPPPSVRLDTAETVRECLAWLKRSEPMPVEARSGGDPIC